MGQLLPEVEHFDCGDSPWAMTINDWIKNGDALKRMRKGATRVWLYYDGRKLVGYGSLGITRWRVLFPDDPTKQILILPSVGVQKQDQRKGFGRFILNHLVAEAQAQYRERVATGKSIAPILGLLVHPENTDAKSLYASSGFRECPYFHDDLDDRTRYEGMVKLLD